MDFTQFLQNSYSKNSETDQEKVNKKNKKIKQPINNKDLTNKKNEISQEISSQNKQEQHHDQYNLSTYKNIRKGDFVKVIKLENSELNHYKGYIGEIRDYKKDQTHALIFLHARNTNNYILFPLKHLEKYNF